MPLYMTISRGERPSEAEPVLSLSDQRIIQMVLNELGRPERLATSGYSDEPNSTPQGRNAHKQGGREKRRPGDYIS